jgi:hypothetical protein
MRHEAPSDPEAFLLTEDLRQGEIFHPLYVMYNFQYEGQLPKLESIKSHDEANEFMEQHLLLRGRGYLKKLQGARAPIDPGPKEEGPKATSKLLAADRQLARLNATSSGKKTVSLGE